MLRAPLSRTVLAIRLRQLGDVLSTLGSLRALKGVAPDHRIVFVVDRGYHALLRRVEFIDELLPEPPELTGFAGIDAFERYIEDIRRLHPSCVLDFHSNTRSAILSFLSGAPTRAGFDVRIRKLLYTDVEARAVFTNGKMISRTSHDSALALVRRGGFDGASGTVENTIPSTLEECRSGREVLVRSGIPAGALDRGDVIGLNPGDPYPAKSWPESSFVGLARMLREDGRTVVVLWGPGELDAAKRIVEGAEGAAYLAPALSLDELPGVLKNIRLVVTIDSGLKHLAVAAGVPTVTLFGPTNPDEWHMGGEYDRYLYTGVSCSPCRLKECPYDPPCMTRITPEAVRDLVFEVEREISTR